MTVIPAIRTPFGELLRQVADVKNSLNRLAPAPQIAVPPTPEPVGADPFSVGGVASLAAAAALAAGGAICGADWSLDVDVPAAARRRRLSRTGGCDGWTFQQGRLVPAEAGSSVAKFRNQMRGDLDV